MVASPDAPPSDTAPASRTKLLAVRPLKDLQALKRRCGIPSPVVRGARCTKDVHAAHIAHHLLALATRCAGGAAAARELIVGVDIGVAHLAHAAIELRPDTQVPLLRAWDVRPIDNMALTYNPVRLARSVDALVAAVSSCANPDRDCGNTRDLNVVLAVEHQQFRPMISRAMPLIRCAAVEAMVVSAAVARRFEVFSVSAQTVGNHYSLGKSDKKKAAVVKAYTIIDQMDRMQVTDDLKTRFFSAKKKDDLADALLTAFASVEWRKNSLNELRILESEGMFR
ncbi:hypothetical protein HDU82_004239 [Entophlyctis luteolus]|nr:hypothetical protein HDU82_004239 [Entophlyctis luteolus]